MKKKKTGKREAAEALASIVEQPAKKPTAAQRREAAAIARAAATGSPLSQPIQPWMRISDDVLMRTAMAKSGDVVQPYKIAEPPPGVLPKNYTAASIAMDSGFEPNNAVAWAAAQVYNNAFFNGVAFLGYPYLSELAQRPEYRKISEILATEMTREWIELKSVSGGKDSKAGRIKQLVKRMDELDVRGAFRKMTELDGFFGRAHLYIDTGDTDDLAELKTSIGDGRNNVSKMKFKGKPGFLKALRPIEPVWTYPAEYDALDPLKGNWYNPQQWFVQGKRMHVSRLLCFVGREVPDMLKPAYSFGGLSMSQMAKPYVDNWLRTRQSVADLIWSFSVMVLKSDLGSLMGEGGDALLKRALLFANVKTNQGLMLVDKASEDFANVAAPLGSLDKLQAQSQEQMCSVTNIPVVKLLGVQPSGLNASSEGELTTWYENVGAFQEKFYRHRLQTIVDFVQLDLWGEIDADITFEFVPLEDMSEEEEANVRKVEADTDAVLVGAGILAPEESRKRLAGDRKSPYDGLDVEEVPESAEPAEGFDGDLGGKVGFGEQEAPARLTRLTARLAEREEREDPEARREGREGRGRGERRARVRPESELV